MVIQINPAHNSRYQSIDYGVPVSYKSAIHSVKECFGKIPTVLDQRQSLYNSETRIWILSDLDGRACYEVSEGIAALLDK